MRRPLAGIRVLELGQILAGPFAGAILGYFGAEVIKYAAVCEAVGGLRYVSSNGRSCDSCGGSSERPDSFGGAESA